MEEKQFHLLIISDSASRFTKCRLLFSKGREDMMETILQCWIKSYAKPEFILTDHGRQFIGRKFAEFCAYHNIKHITTTPHIIQNAMVL